MLVAAGVRWRKLDAVGAGHVLRTVSRTTGPSGPAEQITDFSDFRAVDGLTWAFKRAIKRAAKAMVTA